MYDIAEDKWYLQPTTGRTPPDRKSNCAVVTSASDGSSHQVRPPASLLSNNTYRDETFRSMYTAVHARWTKITTLSSTTTGS